MQQKRRQRRDLWESRCKKKTQTKEGTASGLKGIQLQGYGARPCPYSDVRLQSARLDVDASDNDSRKAKIQDKERSPGKAKSSNKIGKAKILDKDISSLPEQQNTTFAGLTKGSAEIRDQDLKPSSEKKESGDWGKGGLKDVPASFDEYITSVKNNWELGG